MCVYSFTPTFVMPLFFLSQRFAKCSNICTDSCFSQVFSRENFGFMKGCYDLHNLEITTDISWWSKLGLKDISNRIILPQCYLSLIIDTYLIASLSLRSPEILYWCHLKDALEKKETTTKYGHWEFYKFPFQNRYVSCGEDNVLLRLCWSQLQNFHLSKPLYIVTSQRRSQGDYTYNIPNVGAISSNSWIIPIAGSFVPFVLEMVQNSFLRIKDYKSCLLWVIIDFWGVPPSFFFLSIPRYVVGVLYF